MTQMCVYAHCRPDGSPFYIGKGTIKRAHALSRSRNAWHANIVAKYGAANISITTQVCASEKEAFFREMLAIKALRLSGYALTNLTDGGEGTSGLSIPRTAEWKRRIGQGNKGKVRSDATKRKISETVKRLVTDEVRVRLRAFRHTDEAKLAMSLARKGLPRCEEANRKTAKTLRERGCGPGEANRRVTANSKWMWRADRGNMRVDKDKVAEFLADGWALGMIQKPRH